jgi:drug/metabolite transporter (DMT)-like permease
MLTALFVAARILASPVSNVFQKQLAQGSANPLFIIGATHALLTLGCLPLVFAGSLPLDPRFWTNIAVCAALAVAGNVLLVCALSSTGLSVLGPINAYKSVVGLVLGIFLIGEVPTLLGAAGVLLILAGSYFVVDRDIHQPRRHAFAAFFSERGIQFRFAALILSATEAVFLKKARCSPLPSPRSSSGRFSGSPSPPRPWRCSAGRTWGLSSRGSGITGAHTYGWPSPPAPCNSPRC